MQGIHAMLMRKLGSLLRCQQLELPMPGKNRAIAQGHSDILGRIRAGDPDGAAAAMWAHLSGSISRIAELRHRHPGYFSIDD